MQSLENLNDLFLHELQDLYDAEQQLVTALPLLAQAATSPQLREAFEEHAKETKEQGRRVEQILKAAGETAGGKTCKAMAGLIAEARELLDADADPDVLDSALIVAAQKVEHYEIAGYGSARTFARVLNYGDAARLLETTLKEESRTDERLNRLAEQQNSRAETADQSTS